MKNTKELILYNACKLFAEKGYKKTTIAEICSQANVNIASVNYHFRSKSNLYRSAIQFAYKLSEKHAPLKTINSYDLPPERKLYLFVKTVLYRIYSDGEASYLPKMFLFELTHPTGVCDDIVNKIRDEFRNIIITILKDIVQVDDDIYPLLVYSIMSQCLFLNLNPNMKRKGFNFRSKEEQINFLANHIYKFSIAALKTYKEIECKDM